MKIWTTKRQFASSKGSDKNDNNQQNTKKTGDSCNFLTQKELDNIIKNTNKRVNLFSGNCGIFAIALARFLSEIGGYNLYYLIYVNQGGTEVSDYFDGEPDVYHVVLSVEGNGIDGFFDGHGDCEAEYVYSILSEYGLDFDSVTTLKLEYSYPRVETFIRSNTNYDSSLINENGILSILRREHNVVKNERTAKMKSLSRFSKINSDEYLYHGGYDFGENPELKKGYEGGKQSGRDAGGIFLTPSESYARQYVKPNGALYRASLPSGEKIFDIKDSECIKKFIDGSKYWDDYADAEAAKIDALRIIQAMLSAEKYGAIDWATGSQYVEEFEKSGFTGVKFLEREYESIKINLDGSYTLSGPPVYSYVLFRGALPVEKIE